MVFVRSVSVAIALTGAGCGVFVATSSVRAIDWQFATLAEAIAALAAWGTTCLLLWAALIAAVVALEQAWAKRNSDLSRLFAPQFMRRMVYLGCGLAIATSSSLPAHAGTEVDPLPSLSRPQTKATAPHSIKAHPERTPIKLPDPQRGAADVAPVDRDKDAGDFRRPASLRFQPGDPATVEVREGDTLSRLALEHLGDAGRWPELFEANRGRAQPNGGPLLNPDLILPGWELRLPRSMGTSGPDQSRLPGDNSTTNRRAGLRPTHTEEPK